MSKKDKKPEPDGLIPWESRMRLDELPRPALVEPPEGVEVTRELLEGALVAHAMELQKELGMPYDEPQVAVEQMGLPWEKVKAVLPYWKALAATLPRKPGRPKKTEDDRTEHPGTKEVLVAVRDYLYENPGAVRFGPTRKRKVYSKGYRDLVLRLLGPGGPGEGMTLVQAESTTSVPANTLAAWQGRKRSKRRRGPK